MEALPGSNFLSVTSKNWNRLANPGPAATTPKTTRSRPQLTTITTYNHHSSQSPSESNMTNPENLPVARAMNNDEDSDIEQNLPVAEQWSSEEAGPLLRGTRGPDGKDKKSSFGFQAPVIGDNGSVPTGGYWGRFNDPQASSVTVLPAGATLDESLPVAADARLDDRKIRHAFIRKVYMILTGQLMVTFASCALMSLHEPTRTFVLGSGMPLYWFNAVSMFVLVCFLSAYKRSYPINMILLSAFTVSSSYLVGTVTAMFAEAGAGDLVLEAVFITATVFIILTIFTLQSKWDFSFLGAGLGMSLWILILWGLFAAIFGAQAGMVYSLAGSILFSLFIIYDTYMLAERHDPEDYVIAAVELYLDLINLFLYILQILANERR